MTMMKQIVVLLALAMLATGCHTVTNLTPAQVSRNTNGLYNLEMMWTHQEAALRPQTVKASVMVGHDFYPMERTPLLKGRYEALVPIPANRDSLYYRFKIDFEKNAIPEPRAESVLSQEYKLSIMDQK
ncbi:MAG: hypothetical protein WCO56_25075 [Verrucomicrobiota bacterium]